MLLLALLLAANARPSLPGRSSEPPPAVAAPTRPTVPILDPAALAACPEEQLRYAMGAIGTAIEVGAPTYNTGNHAACYWIYLGTAVDLGNRITGCPAVQAALGDGIKRAAALSDYTSQAWAMRDAFDGLIYAYERLAAEKR